LARPRRCRQCCGASRRSRRVRSQRSAGVKDSGTLLPGHAASSTASTPSSSPLPSCGTLRLFTSLSKKNTLKRLAILGSTGSIGQSTLSIVEQFPDRYQVAALAAGRNLDQAFAQAVRWRPKVISLATEDLAAQLASRLKQPASPASMSSRHRGNCRLLHLA